jgi:hypothetical protein
MPFPSSDESTLNAGAVPPVVSVITAAYRADRFLQETIRALLAQTFRDFEAIISDDANERSTQRLVSDFSDPRLRYIANPAPLGIAGNHWAALSRARGRCVAILNHDDAWEPDFLASLVPILDRNPDVVLAFCDHHLMDQDGRLLPEQTDATSRTYGRHDLAAGPHGPFWDLLFAQAIPMAMGALFRRSVLGTDAESYLLQSGPAYDLCLACLLCLTGKSAWYVPQRLTRYRIHPESATSRGPTDLALGMGCCWDELARRLRGDAALQTRAQALAANSLSSAAVSALRRGERQVARQAAVDSLRRRLSARASAALMLSLLPGSIVRRALGSR